MGNQQSGSSSKGKSSKFHGGGQSTGYKLQQVPICSVTLRSWHVLSWTGAYIDIYALAVFSGRAVMNRSLTSELADAIAACSFPVLSRCSFRASLPPPRLTTLFTRNFTEIEGCLLAGTTAATCATAAAGTAAPSNICRATSRSAAGAVATGSAEVFFRGWSSAGVGWLCPQPPSRQHYRDCRW